MLSYYLFIFIQTLSETFSATFSVIYDFASFWHPKWGAYAVCPKSTGVHHISHQDCSFWMCASLSKWTCQPWDLKQKNIVNVSNMSDLQHFARSFITHPWLWWPVGCPHAKDITLSDVGGIILSSTRTTPQRWCLRFPMGSRNIPSIPIQLANSRCDPPHVGTTEQENIIHDAIWTFDGKHNAKC